LPLRFFFYGECFHKVAHHMVRHFVVRTLYPKHHSLYHVEAIDKEATTTHTTEAVVCGVHAKTTREGEQCSVEPRHKHQA